MYAHNLPDGGGTITGRHAGAELMYYGGTIIGLALAIIAMAQWYQLTGRALAHAPLDDQMTRPGTESQPRIWSTVLRCEGSPAGHVPRAIMLSSRCSGRAGKGREGTVALVDRGYPETGPITAHRIASVCAGFRFPPEVISLAVRWYLRYGLSCQDVEELLAERGIAVGLTLLAAPSRARSPPVMLADIQLKVSPPGGRSPHRTPAAPARTRAPPAGLSARPHRRSPPAPVGPEHHRPFLRPSRIDEFRRMPESCSRAKQRSVDDPGVPCGQFPGAARRCPLQRLLQAAGPAVPAGGHAHAAPGGPGPAQIPARSSYRLGRGRVETDRHARDRPQPSGDQPSGGSARTDGSCRLTRNSCLLSPACAVTRAASR